MSREKIKDRAKLLEIEDPYWYTDAYMRCALRIRDEEAKGNRKNLDRLRRQLQTLFDKIVADIEDENTRAAQERAAALAISDALGAHHLPKTCRPDFGKESA